MRVRHLLALLLVLATGAALVPSAASAARTPQIRKMFVKDAQYCLALGQRPRVQIELSAPGKVMFTVFSVDPTDPLKLPKKTAGPKTVTLPQGVSVLEFPVAFGKSPRDFVPAQLNMVLGVPFTGLQIGTPSVDAIGFLRLPSCG